MTRKPIDVFGLGQCCIDYIVLVDSYPSADSKSEFREMVVQGGGPVATALVALSRWGVPCAFAGVAGEDRFGVMIHKKLVQEGIDADGLLIRKGHMSQFAFIAAEPGVGRRTAFWRRPTGPPARADEIDLDRLRGAKVLHTDGLFAEASLAAAREARGAGISVVVDAGSLREGMIDLAMESDYFIASEKFARELLAAGPTGAAGGVGSAGASGGGGSVSEHSGGGSGSSAAQSHVDRERARAACGKLAELGPRVVGVTLGDRGYVALAGGKWIDKPAYEIEAVDTTGCGDVFHAGVTFGVVKGWDIEKSLDFAAWAAARTSTRLGGREGIPTREEVAKEGWHR
jgi:ribokinase